MSLSLARAPGTLTAGQVLDNSSTGLKTGTALKPDLVADGFGVLAANSPLASNRKWQLLNGTSAAAAQVSGLRSEEHTSELQSLMRISYAVFCLKKKKKKTREQIK